MSTPTFANPTTDRGEVELAVTGLTCGSCATRVQRVLTKREGVDDAAVNFATAKATVRFDPGRVSIDVESAAAAGSRGGEVPCTVGPLEVGRAAIGLGGDALCTVPALASGQHALVATYSGDDLTSPSSGVTTHVVERSTTTITIVDGPGPVGADPTDARQDGRVRDHA